jgi:hypothetical protein
MRASCSATTGKGIYTVDDDIEDKVIVMNRNRERRGPDERFELPSPGELADGLPNLAADRGPVRKQAPEAVPEDYQPPPKKSDPLPRPGDQYRAHARFLNRLHGDQRLIHFVDQHCWCEGFCYSDLRRVRWLPPASEGSGPLLELRFVESVVTDVRIEGRNLEDIHHWISEQVMPWVREQPAGFKTRDDKMVVITDIGFSIVEK